VFLIYLFIAWVADENYFEGRVDKGIGTFITTLQVKQIFVRRR